MAEDKIVLDGVTKKFPKPGNDGGDFVAMDGLSFTVGQGERIAIIGRTGCGKSTCLNLINGLFPATTGTVRVEGLDPWRDFMQLKGRIATVFQTDRLLPWRSALENAELGLQILEVPREEREGIARQWLERVGLSGFEQSYPHQLSGGMRQRVNLARAFSLDPSILLLDEAFGHLDEVTGRKLRADFMELVTGIDQSKAVGTTVVFVTHQIEEAIEVANRVIALDRPAKVIADIHIADEVRGDLGLMSEYRTRLVNIIGEASAE